MSRTFDNGWVPSGKFVCLRNEPNLCHWRWPSGTHRCIGLQLPHDHATETVNGRGNLDIHAIGGWCAVCVKRASA